MASDGLMSRVQSSIMPTLAILTHELRGLVSSWLVRLWLIAAVIAALFLVAGNWTSMRSAPLIASVLFSYLVFPWVLVVIVLGISPVTGSRLDALADGILSRPVTRHEYLFACWLARVLAVLAVFLAVTVPAILLIVFAERTAPKDSVTFYGVVTSLVVVSLVLTFLVSLAFLAGTLLRNALLAVVVLVFVWIPINLVLHRFSLEEFSLVSLSQAMPTVLRTRWNRDAGPTSGSNEAVLRSAMQWWGSVSGVLATETTPADEPKGNFFEQGSYEDFSVLRVLLGYGLPTLGALGLSVLLFCWRDL